MFLYIFRSINVILAQHKRRQNKDAAYYLTKYNYLLEYIRSLKCKFACQANILGKLQQMIDDSNKFFGNSINQPSFKHVQFSLDFMCMNLAYQKRLLEKQDGCRSCFNFIR